MKLDNGEVMSSNSSWRICLHKIYRDYGVKKKKNCVNNIYV